MEKNTCYFSQKALYLLILVFLVKFGNSQGVAINTDGSSANSSAMLDIKSTDRGMLIPRMTQAERNGISSPASSLLIYQTDNTPGFYYWDGGSWVRLSVGTDSFDDADADPSNEFQNLSISGHNITLSDGGGTVTVPDANTTYSAGNQLSLSGTTFNVQEGSGSGLDADLLDGHQWSEITGMNGWTDDGTVVRLTTNSDNVGIGTNSPAEKLDVSGNLHASGVVFWGNSNTRTETRNDAGLQGNAGAKSGFYETSSPTPTANWPDGASSWWHLIDIRHNNPTNNYAMQFAGSFYDQKLYFRKTNNNASQNWTEVLTNSSFNNNITLDHSTSSIVTNGSWQVIPGLSRTIALQKGDVVFIDATGAVMQASGYSSSDIAIRVDGNDLSAGGYTKVSTDNYYSPNAFSNFTIFGKYIVPSDGSYTFTVEALLTGSYYLQGGTIGGNSSSVTQSSMKIQILEQ